MTYNVKSKEYIDHASPLPRFGAMPIRRSRFKNETTCYTISVRLRLYRGCLRSDSYQIGGLTCVTYD
jgi:hypothetical protein